MKVTVLSSNQTSPKREGEDSLESSVKGPRRTQANGEQQDDEEARDQEYYIGLNELKDHQVPEAEVEQRGLGIPKVS